MKKSAKSLLAINGFITLVIIYFTSTVLQNVLKNPYSLIFIASAGKRKCKISEIIVI